MSDDSIVDPPKRNNHATRFKKGISGNPKGRPKRSKNKSTIFEEVINTRVPVIENGKKKMISKHEAAFIQAANKAASGDLRAIRILEQLYDRYCGNTMTHRHAPAYGSGQSSNKPTNTGFTIEEAKTLYDELLTNAKSEH